MDSEPENSEPEVEATIVDRLPADFWGVVGARPFGCSEKQIGFVKAYLLPDVNQTEAARRAGYQGNRQALHVAGSRTLNTRRVSDLLSSAQTAIAAGSDEPETVLPEELLRMWSKTARHGKTEAAQQRAQGYLAEYFAVFKDRPSQPTEEMLVAALHQLAEERPDLAKELAKHYGGESLVQVYVKRHGKIGRKQKPNGAAPEPEQAHV